MGLVVVGSVALDSVTSPAGEREEILGGSAIYFSTAASYFAPVKLVGVVGEDFPWKEIEFLKSRGVDVEGLETAAGKTFRWSGSYPELGDAETLSTELNVFEGFRPKIPEAYKECGMAFLANIHPDLQLDVLGQMGELEVSACDTMNFWIESQPDRVLEVFSRAHVAFINDSEVRSLTGEPNLPTAIENLRARGLRVVIVKKGEHGALMSLRNEMFAAPAFPVREVKDPTGAGDSFAGGMMGYLRSRETLDAETFKEALIYGTVMASFAVEGFGVERLKALKEEEILGRAAGLVRMSTLRLQKDPPKQESP